MCDIWPEITDVMVEQNVVNFLFIFKKIFIEKSCLQYRKYKNSAHADGDPGSLCPDL